MKSPTKSIKSGVIWDVVRAVLAKIEATEVVADASLEAAELAAEKMLELMEEKLPALSRCDEMVSVTFLKASVTTVLRFAGGQIYWFRTSQPLMRSAVNGLYGKFGSWE